MVLSLVEPELSRCFLYLRGINGNRHQPGLVGFADDQLQAIVQQYGVHHHRFRNGLGRDDALRSHAFIVQELLDIDN